MGFESLVPAWKNDYKPGALNLTPSRHTTKVCKITGNGL